ncbi:SAC3 domain-containing [Pyrrhoderma noxium]|uniref:SAC3 domain-containing n=1 Tax=Pyrrhoderma noxium TaxID=2282107 RepID=A0A286U658_9AGAM|nr:SAC3 domain-containing [Pyrrhoderma noxium]
MNDVSAKAGSSTQTLHKPRQSSRGGNPSNRGHGFGHGHSKNKTWVSGQAHSTAPAEGKWERGRGSGTYRGRGNRVLRLTNGRGGHHSNTTSNAPSTCVTEDEDADVSEADADATQPSASSSTPSNGQPKTWEELVKAREAERARAIREGKMDDPTKPKRLDEAITIVGTCQDMCPEFERYRRERENNLDKWECILGPDGKSTKKVDHSRAVKIYERGQGDKIIPSDLRPAPVLKRTLDYLFHDLIPRGGFAETQAFVRDRSRAVRTDFTMQQDMGPVAIDCHERCTRFHILSLHLLYDVSTFDRALEIQQLMNSLLSLKEFYDEQRNLYQSPNELEMRIYQRLGLIRDQRERSDKPPPHIESDPAFQLITRFRAEVQAASSPITKTSKMRVNAAAMNTFAELAGVLRQRGNIIMIYLTACFLEHIFGKDTIDDIETIRGSLSIQDIIDGNSGMMESEEVDQGTNEDADMEEDVDQDGNGNVGQIDDEINAFIGEVEGVLDTAEETIETAPEPSSIPSPLKREATQWLSNNFGSIPGKPIAATSFPTIPNPSESVFGKLVGSAVNSASTPSVFGAPISAFGNTSKNVFGGPVFGVTPSVSVTPPAPVPKVTELPRVSVFNPTPSTAPQEPSPLRKSLADAPPLVSSGAEDRLDPSEALQTLRPPPFASSHSAPLNPAAPAFEPTAIRASLTATPSSSTSSASRANLPPLRTDSLLQSIVDPKRHVFATPVAASPSNPFSPSNKPATSNSLSIDTGVSRKPFAIDSPIAPPPLSRKVPISLPGTPTATSVNFALPSAGPSTPTTPYHVPGLRVNIAPSPSFINTFPSTRFDSALTPGPPSTVFSSPLASTSFNADSIPPIVVVDEPEEPVKEVIYKKQKSERRDKADFFRRTRGLIPELFKIWREKTDKEVEWKMACKRDEEYRKKKKGTSSSLTKSSSYKRQRSASDAAQEQTRDRRRVRRVSNTSKPIDDEELVQRLQQNKEENERRWARGSFVKVIQTYVQSQHGSIPSNWSVWLCMNADNDQTAIWLEKKFDVPNSGVWESEAVFSILVSPRPSMECFPGLIIFECTPLDGVDDEIERKYRVLDDCSRLRDIITMLPKRRHYIPSIMLINWDTSKGSSVATDIVDMAGKYIDDNILRNVSTISIGSGDVDSAFVECLTTTEADISGDLVERLDLQEMFEYLSSHWQDESAQWVEACTSDSEHFNWLMFSHVLSNFIQSLNKLVKAVVSTWHSGLTLPSDIPMPPFPEIKNEQNIIRTVRGWLKHPMFKAIYSSQGYSSASFGQDTDMQDLLDHVLHLAFLHAKQSTNIAEQKRPITKDRLKQTVEDFKKEMANSKERLRAVVKKLPLPAPLRRRSEDSSRESNGTQSRSTSPQQVNGTNHTSTISSPEQEIILVSSPSPTLSAPSVAESSSSIITAAMLRELSRNLLKTYGSGSTS